MALRSDLTMMRMNKRRDLKLRRIKNQSNIIQTDEEFLRC
jgi:hypothetical protein